MGDMQNDQRENADRAQRQPARQQRADQRRAPLRGPSMALAEPATRSLLSVGVLLVVVVLVGALALKAVDTLRPAPAAAASARALLRLAPTSDGMKCVSRIAWSPNDKSIAVLGDTQSCNASVLDSQTSLILIYNARNGEITGRLTPDIDVLASPTPVGTVTTMSPHVSHRLASSDIPGALYATWKDPRYDPRLTYSNLVWTPDSKSLLLPFSIQTSDAAPSTARYVKGLLREGVSDSTLTNAWLDAIHTSESGKLEQWDLTGAVPTLVAAPAAAAAYRWTSDDTLAADASAANGAVGEPIGGASFTVWQPGSLGYTAAPAGGAPSAQDVSWAANIATVSPDGRYFYASVSVSGSLVPPSTAQVQPQEPTLAPHDKALETLAHQLAQAATPDAAARLLVAWRPDGRLLASCSPPQQEATPSAAVVSIYDTTTGRLVKQLAPSVGSQSAPDIDTLQWSPDGKQLLLADNDNDVITIWGPGSLPA